ncbi:helix-turn-helix domain-containing protein [Sphingomonas sp. AR_OL41]|nr:helix-turn-helix domain-containing protein [Sphingomonas sp. AR_OL41]
MNLLKELAEARATKGLSQSNLAARIGVTRLAIARLEVGIGSATRLVAVMNVLEVRLSGIARGPTLPDQLHARRKRLGWSVAEAADRAGLTQRTVEAVEAGGGTALSTGVGS